jgi:hypothetical protein
MFMVVVFCEGVLRAIKWRDEDKETKSYNSLYNWKKSRNISLIIAMILFAVTAVITTINIIF